MKILIDDIFRIINFITVVVVVVYVVRRYGILFIVGMIRQERDEKTKLSQIYKALRATYEEIKNSIKDQEDSYVAMQKKIQTWVKSVDQVQQKEQDLLAIRKKDIEQKQIQKLQSLQQRRLMKSQLPQIIKEVEVELQDHFASDSTLSKKYSSKLLKFLEE